MTHASVFSGIGGPEVAATMLGWDNLFHCEINPFGRAVLDYWYPNAKSYDDITKTDFSEWRGKIDVLTGGFPCQPFSYAGQRRGAEDDRYLWPYMFKCIDAIRPTWVVAENVGGILTMVEQGEVSEVGVQGALFGEEDAVRRYELRETFTLERICDDLETHGYSVQPVLVPACAVGAPHRRDRVFIVGRRRDGATDGGGESVGEETGNVRYGLATVTEDEGLEGYIESGRSEQERTGVRGLAAGHDTTDADEHAAETNDAENAVCDGLQRGHSEEQGHKRDERNAGAGDSERLCDEGSRFGDTRAEWNAKFYRILRNPADACCQCREQLRPEQPENCVSGPRQPGRGNSEDGCGGNPADTDRKRLEGATSQRVQGCPRRRERDGVCKPAWDCCESGNSEWRDCCGERWDGFPSQSPVHRGNDGLPFPLDDLTLSPAKWRTEALKAYGNAIVPQVMYEIFRAIEIAENTPPRCPPMTFPR